MPHKTNSAFAGFQLSGFNKFIVGCLGVGVAGLYLAAAAGSLGNRVGDADSTRSPATENNKSAAVGRTRKSGLVYASLPRYRLFGEPDTDLAGRAKALSGPIKVANAEELHNKFSAAGFTLSNVRDGAEVPRVVLVQLPGDLSSLQSVKSKKSLFIRSMLPIVLQANEKVRTDRLRLLKLMVRNTPPGEVNRAWLLELADHYGANSDNLRQVMKELKVRMDIIPPSLALAQGAEESGWGTSRFAIKGNAVFGQWTYKKGKGIVPDKRDEGARHEVRAFDELRESVEAYMHNLNTHRAYRKFRGHRSALRHKGSDVTGVEMIKTLGRYSQRGAAYIATIRTIMRVNGMDVFDRARLRAEHGEDT